MLLTMLVAMISRRSRCERIASGKRSRTLRREVLHQVRLERGVVGEVGVEHLDDVGVLRVGDHHGELGSAQPTSGGLAFGDLLVGRQELEVPVEVALGFERVEVAGVHVDHRQRLRPGDHQRQGLGPVVVEHQLRDLVGHLDQQFVALLHRQLAVADELVEQDLDVDLVVAAVDAGRVVDRVGVDQPAVERVLHPCELGEAEVAALADDAGPQLVAVRPAPRRWPGRRRRRGSPTRP